MTFKKNFVKIEKELLVDYFNFKVHQDAHFRISFYFIFHGTVDW